MITFMSRSRFLKDRANIPFHRSLFTRTFVAAFLLSTIPVIIIGAVSYHAAKKALLIQAEEDMQFMIEQKLEEINELLQTQGIPNEKLAASLIQVAGEKETGYAPEKRISRKIIEEVGEFKSGYFEPSGKSGYAFILDERGIAVVHPVTPGLNAGNEEFFRKMLAEKNGAVHYMWKNEGEQKFREKYAVYRTLNNGWILAASTYAEDLAGGIAVISRTILVVITLVVFFGFGIALLFTRSITLPIETLSEALHRIAEGDLSRKVAVDSRDEMGLIAHAAEKVRLGWLNIIAEVDRSSAQLAASSQQLASSAVMQNEELVRVSSAVEKMDGSVRGASSFLGEITGAVEEIRRHALEMRRRVDDFVVNMKDLYLYAGQTSESLSELQRQAGRISATIETIAGIADQTKLLALNAAIEAARAGEYGRGFAVVAEEIRKLAERSTESAKEITGFLQKILLLQIKANEQMVQTKAEVNRGEEILIQVVKSQDETVGRVAAITERLAELNMVMQQVAKGSGQVAASADDLARIARENTSMAQNMAAHAEELASTINHYVTH
ncbi:MAG: methyl-accepting chemotaxis protein [Peptococcaceae bacterium]|nr:methyl-accepting chemotaxis protein [Peptococcaceae bacterium]